MILIFVTFKVFLLGYSTGKAQIFKYTVSTAIHKAEDVKCDFRST